MASADLTARYTELEAAEEDKRRARMRRQPVILVGLVAALTLATGVVASVDLRRLQTPQGVALRWAQAATFGDCDDYLHYSTGALERPHADVCRSLRAGTQEARQHNVEIGLTVKRVTRHGATAVVDLEIRQRDAVRAARLDLQRTGGRWRVVRDATSCAAIRCA